MPYLLVSRAVAAFQVVDGGGGGGGGGTAAAHGKATGGNKVRDIDRCDSSSNGLHRGNRREIETNGRRFINGRLSGVCWSTVGPYPG